MIAFRRQIERGLANPWLRPVLILLLALLLAFMVFHAAHDGTATATDMGVCLGIVLALSAILVDFSRALQPPRLIPVRSGRAPPRSEPLFERLAGTLPLLIPLRR